MRGASTMLSAPSREHHEDLAARSGQEGQAVIQPVTAPQHDLAPLHDLLLVERKGLPGEEGDADRQSAGRQVCHPIADLEHLERRPDQGVRHQAGERTDRDQPAEGLRSTRLVDPLQRQRALHGLVVMETDRHQDGRQIQAEDGREEPCQGGADPQQGQCRDGQHLLAHDQQHEHNAEGQKPRDLPQALEHPDLGPGEAGSLDGEVVQQRLPGRETQRHACRHQQQQALGTLPVLLRRVGHGPELYRSA
jgi:hypothetical protein